MKKFIIVLCGCALLGLVLFFSIDRGRRPEFDFRAEDVKTITVYRGGVPYAAEKKTVTDKKDIEAIVKHLSGIRLGGKPGIEDLRAGGIGVFYKIVLTNDKTEEFHVSSGDNIFRNKEGSYKIKWLPEKLIEKNLWNSLNYTEYPAAEEELPKFGGQ